jgi:hypothetical protein
MKIPLLISVTGWVNLDGLAKLKNRTRDFPVCSIVSEPPKLKDGPRQLKLVPSFKNNIKFGAGIYWNKVN